MARTDIESKEFNKEKIYRIGTEKRQTEENRQDLSGDSGERKKTTMCEKMESGGNKEVDEMSEREEEHGE